jgi:tRNA-specific 2-thiouridylase
MSKRVLVAMSGGVDSSVAAALLQEQGYEVIGVTMQLWDYSKNEASCDPNQKFDSCCNLDDVADARAVAHKLGIPFYVIDYKEDFQEKVVDYFVDTYLQGMTPNPCVACNTFLKFDHLLSRAKRLGCSFIATGHYAQIKQTEGNVFELHKGLDDSKDQSYFLYALDQEKLSQILFPLGSLTKLEVRELATRYGLVNAQKKESMEICFIPNNDYAKFIETHVDSSKVIRGTLKHEEGHLLGTHDGIHRFTVGQRKGVGVASGTPLYVTRIEPQTGTVYMGEEHYLNRKGFKFTQFHTLRPFDLESPVEIKIRYRSRPVQGYVKQADTETTFDFELPQKSVSPGQIAVVYKGTQVLGGGFIQTAWTNHASSSH